MVCKFKQIVSQNIVQFDIGRGKQIMHLDIERLNLCVSNPCEKRFIERMVKYYTNKNGLQ